MPNNRYFYVSCVRYRTGICSERSLFLLTVQNIPNGIFFSGTVQKNKLLELRYFYISLGSDFLNKSYGIPDYFFSSNIRKQNRKETSLLHFHFFLRTQTSIVRIVWQHDIVFVLFCFVFFFLKKKKKKVFESNLNILVQRMYLVRVSLRTCMSLYRYIFTYVLQLLGFTRVLLFSSVANILVQNGWLP